jgi:hypothetical protein
LARRKRVFTVFTDTPVMLAISSIEWHQHDAHERGLRLRFVEIVQQVAHQLGVRRGVGRRSRRARWTPPARLLLRPLRAPVPRRDRPPHRDLRDVVSGASLEAELRQRTRDVDQAILYCVFELRVVAPHHAAAHAADRGRTRAEEIARAPRIAAERGARARARASTLRAASSRRSTLDDFERRPPWWHEALTSMQRGFWDVNPCTRDRASRMRSAS